MKKTALLLAAACLLLTGCLPESINPLSTPATSLIDGRLEGVYQQIDKDRDVKLEGVYPQTNKGYRANTEQGYWHFHYRGASDSAKGVSRTTTQLEILAVGHELKSGLDTTRYRALATKIAGHDYLSFVEPPKDGSKKQRATYGFARYEVTWRGDLRMWMASESAFVAAVKAGQLRGKITPSKFGDSVLLTDTTANLAAFIAAGDPGKLFDSEPMTFRRLSGAGK